MNRTVTLVRYANIPGKGWRRGAAVLTKNGKLRPDVMTFCKVEVLCPDGRFQIRRYEGKRPIYTDLGNDAPDALNRFRAAEKKNAARTSALDHGWELVAPIRPGGDRKSLAEYAKAFLKKHENAPHRSDDAVRKYTFVTTSFLDITSGTYPADITIDEIIEWHAWMRRVRNYSDRTCSNHYKSLRSFLKYCGLVLEKLIDAGDHKMLKAYTKKLVDTYTPEQVQALIAASTDDNRALLWDLAYKQGLRDSELQMLTRFDLLDLESPNPLLLVRERDQYGRIKDGEERKIELHPSLVWRLRAWLTENPERILIFGTENDQPDTKMLLALKVTARRAGLNCGRCPGCIGKSNECREYTLHRFRRTYVTRMLRATGGDLRSVMDRSGHSDIASVMRYLAPAESIRAAVATAF